jgi:hypothetical protein
LNIETNENLLSSIANPYDRQSLANNSWETTTNIRNGIVYTNRSVSTGDDYPQWWLQLSTNIILSDQVTTHGEEKSQMISLPSPRQQQDQSIQTITEQDLQIDLDKSRRSSRTHKSSSSVTISNHYEIIDEIDDGNNAQRLFPFPNHHQRVKFNRIYSFIKIIYSID